LDVCGIMTATINVYPFACQWIVQGSIASVGKWTYAMCCRVQGENRVVNETDCACCPRREAPAGDRLTILDEPSAAWDRARLLSVDSRSRDVGS
jgi:hypothetical protein